MNKARNPKWTDSNKKTIFLEIELNGEWVLFVASPDDCTDYGPKLFENTINGEYGEVQDSHEERILRGELPVPEGMAIVDGKLVDIAYLEQQATAELNRRLSTWQTHESLALAEIDDEYAAKRKANMKTLLAVKNQSGWPVMRTGRSNILKFLHANKHKNKRVYMKKRNIIWRNKLEEYIKHLYFEQRKDYREIAEIIQKEKNINISREPIRKFINNELLHGKTTEKH